MIVQDDRSEEVKKTHYILIGGTDKFMSGWGAAEGGVSYAFWACRPEDSAEIERMLYRRNDIIRVRQVGMNYRPKGKGHCHIYVYNGHPRSA